MTNKLKIINIIIFLLVVAVCANIWMEVQEMKADAWMDGFSQGSRP